MQQVCEGFQMFTMKTTSPELWEPMQETLLELESANQKVLFTCTSSQGFAAEVLAAVRMCLPGADGSLDRALNKASRTADGRVHVVMVCLLYTSPSPRDRQKSRMPSSA